MKKIVVKIGTNVLSRPDGLLDMTGISHLVDQIAAIKKQGIDIIVVTSGAVGAGRSSLPASKELNKVVQRQVLAAVGQIKLMNIYADFFARYQLHCAQVLATKEDFRDRVHYLNMKNCFQALLRDDIIPIVNENDVISISELMFTDNDELAGLIASMIGADSLLILSNVDGVYDGDPSDSSSKIIPEIQADDKKLQASILPSKSSFGRGGMLTKFRIAQKAASVGISTYIANGKKLNIIEDIVKNNFVGTRFVSKDSVSDLKKWIAYNNFEHKGNITVNEGAKKVLQSKQQVSSLLPIGIVKIEGDFQKGDVIKISDETGNNLGIGIAQYNADVALQYIGQKGKKALIHYDYLFIEQ